MWVSGSPENHLQQFYRAHATVVGLLLTTAFAQQFKVEKKEGHISPLMATLTTLTGGKKDVMVVGAGHR